MFIKKFYIKDILNIAAPIILGNLGFILIGVGDVIVAGRYSTDTLAAISIATSIINCIVMLGIGILTSISAILSNYRGAGNNPAKYFYPSLNFTAILSFIISIVILGCIPLIDKLGFEPQLVPMIKDYFFVTAFSVFGAFLHCMTKEFLQSFEIVVFPNILTVFCIFVNLALNLLFVFKFNMGALGLAIASLITRYFMGIVLLIYCYKKINIIFYRAKGYYIDVLKVGLPSSLAVMIEFVGFNIITIIMGRVAGIYAAAHNIVCTLTSVSFMIPLAISNATAVKVGFTNGAQKFKSLRRYALTGIGMSVAFMSLSAVCVGLFPKFLVSLFTTDPELTKVCIPIVYVLCFFQVFDGLQVSLAGIFRGLKQTTVVMVADFIAFWIVSIPLGCILALHFKLNLLGFWYSLGISVIVACIVMGFVLYKKFLNLKENKCLTSL